MKPALSRLLFGIPTLLTGINPAPAQTPPTLSIGISGGVKITVMGTTGSVYVIQSTGNLAPSNPWASRAFLQISSSNRVFVDATTPAAPSRFYRALFQSPPTNMVFIPPNTFTFGSPSKDLGRSPDEGPQTLVTLSRGFWILEFLVTQADYLAVMGSNPSGFPGDLRRPVESVTWLDATNYFHQRFYYWFPGRAGHRFVVSLGPE